MGTVVAASGVMKRWAIAMLVLGGCGETTAPGGSSPVGKEPAAPLDAGTAAPPRDGGTVTPPRDAGTIPPPRDAGSVSGRDAGVTPPRDAGPAAPVDCSPVEQQADWALCVSNAQSCEVKFTDGAGCAAVCAALSLDCVASYEDVDGRCAPDLSRAPLGCTDTGHASDYCVCASPSCTPDCTNKTCGSDGCGGTCGTCAADQVCDQGQCVMDAGCNSYPYSPAALLAERSGFGRNAAGGDPNNVYHVTTLAGSGAGSLRRALESNQDYWIVFDVNGTITHNTRVSVTDNKTIDGRGRDITIEGTLEFRDTRNVIVSDVALTNTLEGRCGQDGDVITIRSNGGASPSSYGSRDLFFNHLELYDGGDGLFDIRGGSNITLAWTHLHMHKKAILASRTDDGSAAPGMHVTFHHNFFDRTTLRGPQFIYGRAHYYNNYQYHWYEYGAGALGGAQMYSEGNVYEARPGRYCIPQCPDPNPCGDNDIAVSKAALVTDWAENGPGEVISVNDLALNDAEIQTRNSQNVFDPSTYYPYVADVATAALSQRIAAEAGPRVTYCQSP